MTYYSDTLVFIVFIITLIVPLAAYIDAERLRKKGVPMPAGVGLAFGNLIIDFLFATTPYIVFVLSIVLAIVYFIYRHRKMKKNMDNQSLAGLSVQKGIFWILFAANVLLNIGIITFFNHPLLGGPL